MWHSELFLVYFSFDLGTTSAWRGPDDVAFNGEKMTIEGVEEGVCCGWGFRNTYACIYSEGDKKKQETPCFEFL